MCQLGQLMLKRVKLEWSNLVDLFVVDFLEL
jgi:hypothetical protein